jgi:hypothetical protein
MCMYLCIYLYSSYVSPTYILIHRVPVMDYIVPYESSFLEQLISAALEMDGIGKELEAKGPSWMLYLYTYSHTYIHLCVCVCVCVCDIHTNVYIHTHTWQYLQRSTSCIECVCVCVCMRP